MDEINAGKPPGTGPVTGAVRCCNLGRELILRLLSLFFSVAAILSKDTMWQPLAMKRPLVAAFRGAEMLVEEGACLGLQGQQEVVKKKTPGGGIQGPTSFRV